MLVVGSQRVKLVSFSEESTVKATILSVRMCSTELLFCKNQRGSTCCPTILYKLESTTDIFRGILKFFFQTIYFTKRLHITSCKRFLFA